MALVLGEEKRPYPSPITIRLPTMTQTGVAGVMNAATANKYQEKMFDMEKERVDKANARQEKFQTNYEKSKGWN